ncbi:MAG: hypothetical protein AUG09_02700 [Acidobacteria bacterium 13_1_20CM_2_68_7]|nr:MAG: hypothetical protein AUG09_02700 [Acidobacteria bacterium 13_1_20CM_2_68_7]
MSRVTQGRIGSGRIATILVALLCFPSSVLRADTVVRVVVGGDTVSLPGRSAAGDAPCEPCVGAPRVGETITIYTGPDRVRRDRGEQSFILRKDQKKLYLVCHKSKQYAELRYPVDTREDAPKNRPRTMEELSRYDFVSPGKTEEGKVQDWQVRTFSATVTNVLRNQYRLRISVTSSGAAAGASVLELTKIMSELESMGAGWAHLVPLQEGIPVIWEEALREPEGEFVYREEVTDMEERDISPATYDAPGNYKKVKFHRMCWQLK